VDEEEIPARVNAITRSTRASRPAAVGGEEALGVRRSNG
jgi:hypothetical protein